MKIMLTIAALLLLAGTASAQVSRGGTVVIIPNPAAGPTGATGATGPAGPSVLPSPTAISALPTCTAGTLGYFGQVDNQQNTPVWAQTPVATASSGIKAGVYCNGTNWTIFCK